MMTTAQGLPQEGAPRGGVPGDTDGKGTAPTDEGRKPPDLMKFITSIGSPIALATALLFYFGWVRSEEQAKAFGADASVFAMSTQDYVLRSVNVLFFPVIILLLAVLLLHRLDRTLRTGPIQPWLPRLAQVLKHSWAGFLAVGIVLYAVAGRFGDVTLPFWVAWAILGPVYGTVLRRLTSGDRERYSRLTVALLAALVTVTLFWQTERLASLGGEALAQDIQDNMSDRLQSIRLFSAKDLHIAGPGIRTTTFTDPNSAYGYEYSGLYLLQRSGDKYFLLTDGWDNDTGRLIVLPDSATMRVEFGARRQPDPRSCWRQADGTDLTNATSSSWPSSSAGRTVRLAPT
jgi:hypothetical protein